MARGVGRPKKDNNEKYLDAKAKVEEILSLHGPRDALHQDFLIGESLKNKKLLHLSSNEAIRERYNLFQNLDKNEKKVKKFAPKDAVSNDFTTPSEETTTPPRSQNNTSSESENATICEASSTNDPSPTSVANFHQDSDETEGRKRRRVLYDIQPREFAFCMDTNEAFEALNVTKVLL